MIHSTPKSRLRALLLGCSLAAAMLPALAQAQMQAHLPAQMPAQTPPPPQAAGNPSEQLRQAIASYYQGQWAAHPVEATVLGKHEGDGRLDDVRPDAVLADIIRLHLAAQSLSAIDGTRLSMIERDDRDALAGEINRSLLELEDIKFWQRNPDIYIGLASDAIFPLMARETRPAAERMQSAAARLNAIPAMLDDARRVLFNMAPIFVEIGLENSAGAADFLRHDVPLAFAAAGTAQQRQDLQRAADKAADAMAAFHGWLKQQAPHAHGDFRIGTDKLAQILADDALPMAPETVLKAGEAQLAKDRAAFLATAKKIDPHGPRAALAVLDRDHPSATELIPGAQRQLAMLQDFVRSHHILTLPNDSLPKVMPTPPFARALITAEMDAPGPFETAGKQAFYNITPPDPKASKADQAQVLTMLNHAMLQNISVHETMPGHFMQYLYQDAARGESLARLLAGSYATTEGWAHYTEQMMLDEGLGGGDPKLRLAQLQDALLRDCRLVAALRMHMGTQTLQQATAMMQETCFQPPQEAYREARRGTSDPGYFSYTLGKLMILKLRDDLRARQGAAFSLQGFHDRFMASLLIPIPIIRREMLGDSSPPL